MPYHVNGAVPGATVLCETPEDLHTLADFLSEVSANGSKPEPSKLSQGPSKLSQGPSDTWQVAREEAARQGRKDVAKVRSEIAKAKRVKKAK